MAGVASHDDCGLNSDRRRVLEGIFEVLPSQFQGEPGVVLVGRDDPGLSEQVAPVPLSLHRCRFRTSDHLLIATEVYARTVVASGASVFFAS